MLSQKKNPAYIDFKTINEIMIIPSKNVRIIAFRYYGIMLFKYASITLVDVKQSFSH